MQLSWLRLPFSYRTQAEYDERLADFIGQAFYERLPAAGFDIREEQIYSSFRMAKAMTAGKVMLAEAGPGTGKTFAYLIPAVCHARLRGAPVVISVAGSVLQSQLAGPEGDVAALSRLLGLAIEVRVARDPLEHLCELKVDGLRLGGVRAKGLKRMLQWAQTSERGDRSEVPDLPDETWNLIAWDETLPCDTCRRRGQCRQARAREHYRQATDLLICDHRLFLADLWTRRARREEGLRPILPDYSGVVFDEGHLVADAASDSLGYRLSQRLLGETLTHVLDRADRTGLIRATRAAVREAAAFWDAAGTAVERSGQSERLPLVRGERFGQGALALARAIEPLQDELSTDEQMHQGTEEEIRILALQARLDRTVAGLRLLAGPERESIAWAVLAPEGTLAELGVVPRRVDDLLQQELYSQKVPVLFSSATMAAGESFAYMKRVVGAPGAIHAQVGVPFALASQALVYLPPGGADPVDRLAELLGATEGRTLVLVQSRRELALLRDAVLKRSLQWSFLWEGEAADSELLRRFRAGRRTVLAGMSYWEGIDVTGEALSCVAVLRLPFPQDDPVVTARREDAQALGLDPFLAVDVPQMAIKLKQGQGRLIRTATDRGVFALLDNRFVGSNYEGAVRASLPEGAPETDDLGVVTGFLAVPGR